jgi:putative Mg2+ transporter-C (MgtC) family protein
MAEGTTAETAEAGTWNQEGRCTEGNQPMGRAIEHATMVTAGKKEPHVGTATPGNGHERTGSILRVLFFIVIHCYTICMENIVFADIYVNLFVAMALGMVLGIERFVAHKTAGMRTYTLVSLGAAMFVIISQLVTSTYAGFGSFDPMRLAAQIVAAAGFLGVGAIVHKDSQVSGLTTASGLWVAAGIGMAAGFGEYKLALLVTGLCLFTFIVLWFIEEQLRKLPIARDQQNSL